eukprot:TRINITY_DN6679_c0_g1_i1.p1 TRINITY_DN6679_c0_g1~~TRINITY_DN6679_c0_g1_i1.p1  ORF type:complete len:254 (-),score=68.99 TRINITY_DN6679_c0_g1_i1:49-777(-)
MGDLAQWWGELEPVTKWLLALNVGFTFAARFSLVNPGHLYLGFPQIFRRLQVWRLGTCFFVWSLSFNFLIRMFFLYRHSTSLEQDDFRNRRADYVWALLIMAGTSVAAGLALRLPFLSETLVMAILYLWSRKHPDENMTFMFGFRFKSVYLPWVLIGFGFLMGGGIADALVGVGAGHLYFFLADIFPRTHGHELLRTPAWLRRLVPAGPRLMGGVGGAVAAPGQQQQQQRFDWGGGHRLGGQ